MQYLTLHQTQKQVALSNKRFRVVNCGRQWGKTTLSVLEMVACAFAKGGRRVGYFATTHGQARDIAWSQLKVATRNVWSRPPNETRLELYINTQDGGESEIMLKGWESVETSRGTQYDFLVLDEVSKMRNFTEGWQAVLLATLAFRNGKALFISTPYGFNHFHDLYKKSDPDWESFTFTSYDNPHLTKDYLNMVQTTVTPDYWAQEYLAEFRRFTGLVYKEFDLVKHVQDFSHTYNQHGEYIFGLDFAVRGNTAALASYVDSKGITYHLDNYKEAGLTAQEHGQKIKEMLCKYAPFDRWTGYADPAGWMKNQQKGELIWSLADEYIEQGFAITKANNEVVAGINYVRQKHLQDLIVVNPRCEKYIEEKLQYQWKEQPDSQRGEQDQPEKVRKIHDHILDCERYLLFSKPATPEEEKEALPYKAGMLLEFPHWATTPQLKNTNNDTDKIQEFEDYDTINDFDI